MMKILAFVGTNADFSYNRLLLRFMKKHFKQMADIEIYEVGKLPQLALILHYQNKQKSGS